MLKTHELWYSIIESEEKGERLDGATQKALYKIAKRIITEDFTSGDERVLAKKILNAFGYENGKELRRLSSIKNNFDFILECVRLSEEKHNGSLNKMFSERYITILKRKYSGSKLHDIFYEKCKSLKISKRNDKEKVNIKDTQLFEEPFQNSEFDSYRSNIIRLQINEKIRQHMKDRQRSKQKQEK